MNSFCLNEQEQQQRPCDHGNIAKDISEDANDTAHDAVFDTDARAAQYRKNDTQQGREHRSGDGIEHRRNHLRGNHAQLSQRRCRGAKVLQHPCKSSRYRTQGISKAEVADKRCPLGNQDNGRDRCERAKLTPSKPAQIGGFPRFHIAKRACGHGAALPRVHCKAPEGAAEAIPTDASAEPTIGSARGTQIRPSSSSP